MIPVNNSLFMEPAGRKEETPFLLFPCFRIIYFRFLGRNTGRVVENSSKLGDLFPVRSMDCPHGKYDVDNTERYY